MPTPCESCPVRLAVTRFSATIFASRPSLPPAATTASIVFSSVFFLNKRIKLFRLDAALVDDRGPALDFVLHELAEFVRRAGDDVEADLRHALFHRRVLERAHGRVVQLGDDLARRLRRRGRRLPRGYDQVGEAG